MFCTGWSDLYFCRRFDILIQKRGVSGEEQVLADVDQRAPGSVCGAERLAALAE